MAEAKKIAVTIARQLGSGGSFLGHRVARRLGYAYLDREILRRTAEELGLEEEDVGAGEERLPGFWERLLATFSAGCPEESYAPPPLRVDISEEVVEAEGRVLRQLAARGRCVVVGRGGFHLLRGLEVRLVNVFIHAPREYRCRRVMELYSVDAAEAAARVERTDRDRERYIHRVAGTSWYDARNYHLTVDTALSGFEAAEEMVAALVRSAAGEA